MKTTELTEKQIQNIRIAVAELAGWKIVEPGVVPDRVWPSHECRTGIEIDAMFPPPGVGTGKVAMMPPNCPTSLDAVSDIERSLLAEEVDRNHYTRILIRVMSDDLGDFITLPDWNVRFASALQCCVALVKLKNPQKWEEILALN